MLISAARLKAGIIEKFGSQAEFAKKLEVAEGQVTRGIRSQTPKFIARCKRAGIDIEKLMAEQRIEEQDMEKKVSAEERIKELEKLVEHQANLIKSYELILESRLEKLKTEPQK